MATTGVPLAVYYPPNSASSVYYTLYDSAGVLQIARTNDMVEIVSGTYYKVVQVDDTWGTFGRVVFDFNNTLPWFGIWSAPVSATTEALVAALAAIGFDPVLFGWLPLLKNLLPDSAFFKASTLAPIPVPFVPRTDITFTSDFNGFDPGTRFTDAWMGLRTGNPAAPIAGVPDRHITPSTSMESVGQILVPGVEAPNGTSTLKLGFHWTREETALIPPGTPLTYFIVGQMASGDKMELGQGAWPVLTGGTDLDV